MDNGTSHNCKKFSAHRKIFSYRYLPGTNSGQAPDTAFGHGTHVAGTVAGKAQSPDATQVAYANRFDGVASEAKLAVDDLSPDGETLNLPDDLGAGLWKLPYELGVRVHSNSWGMPSSSSYTIEYVACA